jgi:Domain of unknown function DUF29
MNKPAKIVAAPPLPCPDYHTDGYGWAMAQAAIIRERRLGSIDWQNVAEEIESVGKRERSEYTSHMIRVMAHLIKWEAQPERRGMSWWISIMNGRDDAERFLKANPSLKPLLDEIHTDALEYARRQAARETDLSRELIDSITLSRDDAVSREIKRPKGD